MTQLYIAEKPSMGKAIAENLPGPHKSGTGYIETGAGIVTWCVGHLLEQSPPEAYDPKYKQWRAEDLPIVPAQWIIAPRDANAKKQIDIIKRLLSQASAVVHAGDPDREGQRIVDEVLELLRNRKPVSRLWLAALDAVSVKKALAGLVDNAQYANLSQAALARSQADWLVGMNLSRAYTLAARRSNPQFREIMPVGRVQTCTLAIVVRRDLEIEQFVPKDYFVPEATFAVANGSFKARWKAPDDHPGLDEQGRLVDPAVGRALQAQVTGKTGIITRLDIKAGNEAAPLPFSLSDLQIYASKRWGYGAESVLDACQSLYETHKITTYPRTDCNYLPLSQHAEAPAILAALRQNLPDLQTAIDNGDPSRRSRAFNDAKITAHHGIVPNAKRYDIARLSPMEANLYDIIVRRYLGQFYPDRRFEKTEVEIEVAGARFQRSGEVTQDPGWLTLFTAETQDTAEPDSDDPRGALPRMSQGESARCQGLDIASRKTKAPPRYTDGLLIKAMTNVHAMVSNPEIRKRLKETAGIGTEATRSSIIKGLIRRGLLKEVKRGKQTELHSSPRARALIQALPSAITDPGTTALWETALERVSEGHLTLDQFLEKQIIWVRSLVAQSATTTIAVPDSPAADAPSPRARAGKGGGRTSAQAAASGKPCPQCGGALMARTAKQGKAAGKQFLGCANYPKCTYSEWPDRN